MKALSGHFDGRYVVLDEPTTLKPNTKVKVIAVEEGELTEAYALLSQPTFNKIWDNALDADYDKL